MRTQIQDEVRARIQTSQLLNRLQDYIDGKVRLDQGRIRAIEILLRKALPDLSSVEQTGERQKPVVIVTGVPRPWDKPIDQSVQHDATRTDNDETLQ